uniref:Ephrin RBD domain-containing protein n=1 Tax=Strongyloides papillosus TaxID=174720 RepID=A0A0N5B5I2_STREA
MFTFILCKEGVNKRLVFDEPNKIYRRWMAPFDIYSIYGERCQSSTDPLPQPKDSHGHSYGQKVSTKIVAEIMCSIAIIVLIFSLPEKDCYSLVKNKRRNTRK